MLNYSDIAKMFEDMELRIVANLKEQLNNGYELSPIDWQVKKLRNLNAFRQTNAKIMQDYKPLSATKQLIEENFQGGAIEAEKFIGQPHFGGIDSERMEKLIDDMTTLERHVETAALRMTDDVYRRTLHMATLEMSAGTSLEKAIDMATRSFLEQGINCIVYRDGRHINIADYVRMALRTASMKATLQGKSERFSQLGYDTVIISQYDKCSDTCLPYQGKVYIEDTFTLWDGEVQEINGDLWGKSNYCGKWFPLLSMAIDGGLFHPQCRHDMSLYKDGVTKIPEPIDSEKDLKNYRIQQQQRAKERNIRRLKRLAAGTCDEQSAKNYAKQVRQAQAELKAFIADNSDVLHREFEREKIYQSPLTNGENSSIIETERAISFKKTDKAIEYAQSKLSLSVTALSELPVEKVNVILRHISKLYAEMPMLKGFVNEIILEPMQEIATASIKWVDDKPLIRLKLSQSMFGTQSIEEIETFIDETVKNGYFSPKDGLHGLLKHEFTHFAEYYCTLKKYNYSESAVKKSFDNFELTKPIKELALKNCKIEDNPLAIQNYLSTYATENSAEFLAEAYSSTADNKLVNEVKRILKRKWGI